MQRVVISGLLLSLSTSVRAQPAGAQAEALFRQGRSLLESGHIAEACTAFAKSQELDAALTTLINLAGCREQQGELATAWGLFLDVERQTRSATDPVAEQLRQSATDHAAKLESRLSKLTIRVAEREPADLVIARDGDVVDRAMWNRTLPIDGGAYTITVRAKGFAAWTTRVDVGSEQATVTVDVPLLAPLPDISLARPAEPPARVPAYLTAAGALALLGGGLGCELWARSTYRNAEHETIDQARRDAFERSANHQHYAAEALAGAGVVTAAIAVVLWIRGGESSDATERIARSVAISPTGLEVLGSF